MRLCVRTNEVFRPAGAVDFSTGFFVGCVSMLFFLTRGEYVTRVIYGILLGDF